VKAVAQGLISDVNEDAVYCNKLALAVRLLPCVKHDSQQCSDKRNGKQSEGKDIALLHMAQNDLHKLVWQIHFRVDHACLPQHNHRHVHNVLCRQGPLCMCG
jgi:hypothetical protein